MKTKRRKYLSWSQLSTWEKSPDEYYRKYVLGEKDSSIYMDFGSKVAEDFELGFSDDIGISSAMIFIPDFVKREYKIRAKCGDIPLLAKLDGFDPKTKRIDEIKTGTAPWTQKRADEWGQLTFYAYTVYLKYKTLPGALWLHWAQTKRVGDEIEMTGYVKSFETKRIMADLIKMHSRITTAWAGIDKLMQP